MISRRRYRTTVLGHREVLAEVQRVAGSQLDPNAVAALCRLAPAAVEGIYSGLSPGAEPPRGTTGVQERPVAALEVAARPEAATPVAAAPAPRPGDGQEAVLCRCPKCQAAFRVRAAAIPAGGARIRCPRCAEVIPLRPAGGSAGRIAFVT
jgi:predicted Zn finger-like uncharacterized protein